MRASVLSALLVIAVAGCGGAASETTRTDSSGGSQPAQPVATQTAAHSARPHPHRRVSRKHKAKPKPVPTPAPTPPPPKQQKPKPYAGNPLAQRIYKTVKDECAFLRIGNHFSLTRALRAVRQDSYKLPEVAQKACLDAYGQ